MTLTSQPLENVAAVHIDNDNKIPADEALEHKQAELLPTPDEQIEALGIPNWRELEKKIVRRLDLSEFSYCSHHPVLPHALCHYCCGRDTQRIP